MNTTLYPAACFLLPVLLASCGGQARDQGNVTFADGAGETIARAQIDLPAPLPVSGTFRGAWSLLETDASFPRDAASASSYEATIASGRFTIDLNPGTSDNNIILSGAIANGKVTGNWMHSTFAGDLPMGTFTLLLGGK